MLAANDVTAGVFVLGGIVATAIGTWLVARRTKSGKIVDSDADKLWDESTEMRHDLAAQVVALRAEIAQMKADKIADDARWQKRVDALEAKLERVNAELRKLERS